MQITLRYKCGHIYTREFAKKPSAREVKQASDSATIKDCPKCECEKMKAEE